MRSRPVVAIDGPSGVGKSTVARGVAAALDFALFDTGALYRTLAWLADQSAVDWDDVSRLAAIVGEHSFSFDKTGALQLDGKFVGDSIRTPRMSLGASAVSRHKDVRESLLSVQRSLAENGGVVLEGRDIGTVVFPDAEVKFFLTASAKVRAQRRYLELIERGDDVTLEQIEREQEQRDEADRNREVSPLRQADDAVEIRCDIMTPAQVISKMLEFIQK